MKTILILMAVLASTCAIADDSAWTVVDSQGTAYPTVVGNDGVQFTPIADLTVSALGMYDTDQNGQPLEFDATIAIFKVSDSSIVTTINMDNKFGFIQGQFRYRNILPVLLEAGVTYSAVGHMKQDTVSDTHFYIDGGAPTANAAIDLLGWNYNYAPTLTMPTNSLAPNEYFFGPNFLFAIAADPIQVVDIDIKPGSDPNCFNINGHGVIPVAILGSADFDVAEIDTATLNFNGLAVRVRGKKGPLCSYEDSNSDGFGDLVCKFEDESGEWEAGSVEGIVSGELTDGTVIEGTDSICIVPE